jgi:hypothetical protein
MPPKIKKEFLLLAIIGFFIFISIFLIELNYIVFSSITNVFNIAGHEDFLLWVVLLSFSGGFLVMLLIDRYYTGTLIRFFYLFTSIWMGMFMYFFIASLIYFIVGLFIKVSSVIGVVLFLVAIIISIYGIIHGEKIKIKKILISLPNLPNEWKSKKIVWMSDLHLGPIKGIKFAEKITELSNSLSPDLVFVGGDLYDGSHHPDPYILANPLKNLSSRLGTFFITGNHEEFGKPDIFLSAVQKLGIKILQNEMVEIQGLQIIGVDFLNASPKKQFQKILENMKIDKDMPSILLKHEPKDLAVAEQAGISFQISGHTHDGQQWPFNYLVKLMYKGFSYGLKQHGSMPIYISSGAGGWGPPLRVGSNNEIVEITLI